jgi:phospholipid/cholesterol/gamma-HCH transport system permease protein
MSTASVDEKGSEQRPPSAASGLRQVRGAVEQKLKNMVEMIYFFGEVFAAIPRTLKYSTEVLRQAGILILSTGVLLIAVQFFSGFDFGVQGNYIIRQFGAQGYIAVFPAYAGLRFSIEQLAGWIMAAKVGCGLVAEIGSARITEEIDALEVMGIDAMVYLVATRVLAAIIALPFLFGISVPLYYYGSYLADVTLLDTVSPGGFTTILWKLQNISDLVDGLIFAMLCGVTVILVGCYYGYHARGGPVGVGHNTAKSMVVNMVLVSLIGYVCGTFFWGGNANIPIGN